MSDESMPTEARGDDRPQEIGGLYAHYVLMVLVFVYVFNFIDRSNYTFAVDGGIRRH